MVLYYNKKINNQNVRTKELHCSETQRSSTLNNLINQSQVSYVQDSWILRTRRGPHQVSSVINQLEYDFSTSHTKTQKKIDFNQLIVYCNLSFLKLNIINYKTLLSIIIVYFYPNFYIICFAEKSIIIDYNCV